MLEIATRGGAAVLGRGAELGSIEAGKRADLAVWDVSGLEAAGAWDPVAALVLCGPFAVRDLVVEGRPVVLNGRLAGVDLGASSSERGRGWRGFSADRRRRGFRWTPRVGFVIGLAAAATPPIRRSSVVEQLTVNQLVVGSNPTAGAKIQNEINELGGRESARLSR